MRLISFVIAFIGSVALVNANWPKQPAEQQNPGSSYYEFSLYKNSFSLDGRTVDFFAPAEVKDKTQKAHLLFLVTDKLSLWTVIGKLLNI